MFMFRSLLLCGLLFSTYAQTPLKKISLLMSSPETKTTFRKSPVQFPADAHQLVLVITPDWNAVDGTLWRFGRADNKSEWQPTGSATSIVVGRNGMAWGRGLHRKQPGNAPVKKEGDGRSPAGIFSLRAAFGYANKSEAGLMKLPYTHLTSAIECVDDSASAHYNTILDRSGVSSPDWNSSEKMREQKEYYRWGVTVDHNVNPVKKRGGSCIFLHIWNSTGVGTAGCTAMEATYMEDLMRWLDPARKPLLVQLPLAEYQRLRTGWHLPQVDFQTAR